MSNLKRAGVILELITEHGWTRGIEIGVWRGKTMFSLLAAAPALKMVGIDQWKIPVGIGDKNNGGYSDYKLRDMEAMRKKVEMTAFAFYQGRATILHISSLEAAELFIGQSFDFVFIDCDHRASFVRADIAAWMPKVKKGGMLLGHDSNLDSVRVVIDSMLPGWKEYGIDHVWGIKRGIIKSA